MSPTFILLTTCYRACNRLPSLMYHANTLHSLMYHIDTLPSLMYHANTLHSLMYHIDRLHSLMYHPNRLHSLMYHANTLPSLMYHIDTLPSLMYHIDIHTFTLHTIVVDTTADSRRHDPPFTEIRKVEVGLCVRDPLPDQGPRALFHTKEQSWLNLFPTSNFQLPPF